MNTKPTFFNSILWAGQIETKDSTQTSKKTIGDDIDFYEEIEIDDSSEVDNDLDYTTQY